MENIKNKIRENRSLFELDPLPKGHKERFLQKIENQESKSKRLVYKQKKELNGKKEHGKIIVYSLAAAVVLAFIIIPPMFNSFRSKSSLGIIETNYVAILNEKSAVISSMIETLDPINQEMVMSTLDQLVFEAIPFADQLPPSINREEKNRLEESYYYPKIEGMNRLKGYVAQLLEL